MKKILEGATICLDACLAATPEIGHDAAYDFPWQFGREVLDDGLEVLDRRQVETEDLRHRIAPEKEVEGVEVGAVGWPGVFATPRDDSSVKLFFKESEDLVGAVDGSAWLLLNS